MFSVHLVSTTVDLQVILNEVLGKHKILPGAYNNFELCTFRITSFSVFVINIIKMNWIGRIATITNLVRCIYLENASVSLSHLSASCTPECVSESLMKVALFLHWFSLKRSGFLSFFYLVFLSRTFTNHRTATEGRGHFFNSSLPLSPASQTLRH